MNSPSLQELLGAYAQVAGKAGLPPMKLTRCTVTPKSCSSADEVWALLGTNAFKVGWLGFQSGNVPLHGEPAAQRPELGTLMDAELATDQLSIHVRHQGDGWVVSTYTPGQGQGEEFLADEVSLLTKSAPLFYERLWSLDPVHGLRQAHARLIAGKEKR